MSEIPKMLIRYNRVSAPVIAILAGVIVVYLSFFVPDLIFAIPVVTFLIFFWLKIFGVKKRLLASLIVFLAIAIAASAIFAYAVYSANGTASNVQLSNGSLVTAKISPYLGHSNDYNISYYISENTTLGKYWVNINSTTDTSGVHLAASAFQNETYSNGTLLLYAHVKNITSQGIYYSTLYIGNGTYYVYNIGPIITSYTSILAYEMISYIPGYLILFELIFIVGIFLARSISHSAQYSRRRPPESQ